MSREVLGSAVEDAAAAPEPRSPVPGSAPRGAVRLDDKPALRATSSAPGSPAADAPGSTPPERAGAVDRTRTWVQGRLDALRGSRTRTAAALGVVAVVSGLVAVGVTEQVRQARLDAAPGVVAWLDYSSSGVGGTGQAVLKLNVVNTGTDEVTVTAADLEGDLDGTTSGVALDLADELTVPASGYASGTVAATVADCGTSPVARGGARDGELRVTVAGTDLREEVLDGARVGAFPISASTVVELGCGGEFTPTVVVEQVTVRADGRLYVSLRGFTDDVEVSLTSPDGIDLVTDPPSPVSVPGGEGSPLTTIGVELQVQTCTVSAQQLDAGNQVQLVVGDERLDELDHVVVNAWVVREVARSCG